MSHDGFKTIAATFTQLEVLDLYYCEAGAVSDHDLWAVVTGCPVLRKVVLPTFYKFGFDVPANQNSEAGLTVACLARIADFRPELELCEAQPSYSYNW